MSFRHRQIVALHTGERVDDMRAQIRIDVLHREASIRGSVRRPVSVVTHHSLGIAYAVTISTSAEYSTDTTLANRDEQERRQEAERNLGGLR